MSFKDNQNLPKIAIDDSEEIFAISEYQVLQILVYSGIYMATALQLFSCISKVKRFHFLL